MLMLAAAVIAAFGIVTIGRTLAHPGAIADMRSTVAGLRAVADSCATALDDSQSELLQYSDRLDSMRSRVRELEALHPRGVPADSYTSYLRIFGVYNDSAAAWEDRVEELRSERLVCSEAADRHNAAVDSLRRLLARQRR
jgi:predicted  nucleic acid-binding Zn-ribbon protein